MAGEYRWHLLEDRLREYRQRLLLLLGGVCQSCQGDVHLEIHHLHGKT